MQKRSKKQTMTKKELVHLIAQEKNIRPGVVRQIVQAFLDGIAKCLLSGGRLEFRNFGVFEVVKRAQKIGRNPKKAHEAIIIPARHAITFASSKNLRVQLPVDAKNE